VAFFGCPLGVRGEFFFPPPLSLFEFSLPPLARVWRLYVYLPPSEIPEITEIPPPPSPSHSGRDSMRVELGLGVYSALSAASLLVLAAQCYTVVGYSVRASGKLHESLLATLLRLPTSFYDTTPLGRLLNRVSSDMQVRFLCCCTVVSPFPTTASTPPSPFAVCCVAFCWRGCDVLVHSFICWRGCDVLVHSFVGEGMMY